MVSMRNKKNYPSIIIKFSILSRALIFRQVVGANSTDIDHSFPNILKEQSEHSINNCTDMPKIGL